MFVGTSLIAILAACLQTGAFLFQESRSPQVFSALLAFTMILGFVMGRLRTDFRLGMHFQVVSLYFYLVGMMAVTGGSLSPAALLLPLIVYYVYPLLGKKWAVFWVGLWTMTSLVFFALEMADRISPSVLSSKAQNLYATVSAVLVMPLALWLYAIYQVSLERLRLAHQKHRTETSNLLHVISHDLRGPLQIIQSYSQLLNEDSDRKKTEFLSAIHRSVQRITTLLNQVRDYENIMNGKTKFPLKPVNLKTLVKENLEDLAIQFKDKRIQVQVDMIDPTYLILAEAGALSEHVLINILSNAFKFSSAQGLIEISVKKEKDLVHLRIRDYGIGIPAKLQKNIFEFSHGTSRPGTAGEKGSGFGLPIAKMFLDQMEMSLAFQSWVETSPPSQQGTLFTLTFKAVRN